MLFKKDGTKVADTYNGPKELGTAKVIEALKKAIEEQSAKKDG